MCRIYFDLRCEVFLPAQGQATYGINSSLPDVVGKSVKVRGGRLSEEEIIKVNASEFVATFVLFWPKD